MSSLAKSHWKWGGAHRAIWEQKPHGSGHFCSMLAFLCTMLWFSAQSPCTLVWWYRASLHVRCAMLLCLVLLNSMLWYCAQSSQNPLNAFMV
jgi:hypothetical protein